MKLTVVIVGDLIKIHRSLTELINEIETQTAEACCGDGTMDYVFTDETDLYLDLGDAKVIKPFPEMKHGHNT